jgi:ATP-dependent helicase HrpA
MNFRVLDETGRQLGMGRNLAELKREFGSHSEKIFEKEDQERYTGWTFGDLEEMMEISHGDQTLVGYPALVDAEDAVTLQVFDSPEKARAMHRQGVRRLLRIAFRERVRDLDKALSKDMALAAQKADIVAAALDRTFLAESLPRTQADFAQRVQEGRGRLNLIAQEMQRLATALATQRGQLEKRLAAMEKAYPAAVQDVRQQIERLLPAGFLARLPWQRLQQLPRYLKAASLRLEKLRADPRRDAERAAQVAPLEQAWRRELAARARPGGRSFESSAELEQFGWLLEELRVSLFAQELKTPVPVSAKRLARMWHSMGRTRG